MTRALVTGVSGFVGRHLAASLLARGLAVRGLVRGSSQARVPEGVEKETGDIRDTAAVRSAVEGCDLVFHLAAAAPAAGGGEPEATLCRQVNVDGTRALVEAAARAGVTRLVFFSTVKAMGESTRGVADESTEARSADVYGRTKLEAERIAFEAAGSGGAEAVCLRPALVYGPGQKGNIERLIAAVESGRFPPLPENTGRRSLVHVKSLVEAALLCALRPEASGQCYIVADLALSARQLQAAVARALGRPAPGLAWPLPVYRAAALLGDALGRLGLERFPFDSARFEKLFAEAEYSAEKIGRDLGWRPFLDLDGALAEVVAVRREEKRTGGEAARR